MTQGHGQGHGHSHGHGHGGAAGVASESMEVDVREHGAPRDGEPQVLDRRVFFQLLVMQTPLGRDPADVTAAIGAQLAGRSVSTVIYDDANDPRGIGVLTMSEDPTVFVTAVRPVLSQADFGLTLRPEFTMLGRSYSSGFEQDLKFWLLDRPVNTVLEASWPWAIWYPLRRTGEFARLDRKEQGAILREHGEIGKAYGAKNLAHDVRLACHGLDVHDNEFVIGLIGPELHPLSHVVQAMRKTKQTAEYISQMGPFFVGRVAFRHRAT